MAKTKGVVLGEGHVNRVGPSGAFIGDREGRSPGTPQGTDSTVMPQYREGGINTAPNPRGTPYNSQAGNPDEFNRKAEGTGRYGIVLSENGQDHNNPAANGSGIVFDGAERAGGMVAKPTPLLDSPVPSHAPTFDPRFVEAEDRAHLGSGNESGVESLTEGGGVMGR